MVRTRPKTGDMILPRYCGAGVTTKNDGQQPCSRPAGHLGGHRFYRSHSDTIRPADLLSPAEFARHCTKGIDQSKMQPVVDLLHKDHVEKSEFVRHAAAVLEEVQEFLDELQLDAEDSKLRERLRSLRASSRWDRLQ